MFTFRFPINANLVRLVGSDTNPQTLVGPIHSRRYVARHPKTPVQVTGVGTKPKAACRAGDALMAKEGTTASSFASGRSASRHW
jgi:hypothetical protein